MGKKNVSVTANFTADGQVLPTSIIWEDKRIFNIDYITDMRKAASLKAGGIGMRYTCEIRGKQLNLFKDEDIWFIET